MKTWRSTTGQIFGLGLPLLFGQFTQYCYQIADSAMLGHFGDGSLELAAVGIAGLFTWILNTFLWPLSSGIQAITSRRFGRQSVGGGETEGAVRTGEALDNGLVTAVYAAVMATAFSFTAPLILDPLIADKRVLELSLAYIGVLRFSLLPTGIYYALQGFFGAIKQTRYVMYSGVLSGGLNIFLNWIFIFGNLGSPALGIRGAALGTVVSILVSTLLLLAILVFGGYRKEYRLLTFHHLNSTLQKDIVKVALPPSIQNIVALGIFMVYQTIIEDYSTVYLAATHAVFSYMRLNKTIIGGFARSASILVGNALGRADRGEAKSIATAAGITGAAVALAVAAASLLGRFAIARIFTGDLQTQNRIAEALLFFVGFFFIEAIGYTFEMIFNGNGYGRWVLFSESSTNLVFILGATLLARRFFPEDIRYAWLSFGLYQIGHASLMVAGYLRGRWTEAEVETRRAP